MANTRVRRANGIERQTAAATPSRDKDKCLLESKSRRYLHSSLMLTCARSVEKISATLQKYRGILQKLYPTVHPDLLADLPRETLIEMISTNSPIEPPSPITPTVDERAPHISPDAGSLEALQSMPDDSNDGSDHRSAGEPGITDDVNALSLSIKQSSSYLGISSVVAVLRVILWLDPASQKFFAQTPDGSELASREHSSPPEDMEPGHTLTQGRTEGSSPTWNEMPLINAYFSYVHPLIPLIEERTFRNTYMTARRSDPRWRLLLNAVLAMGSIAAGSADDISHHIYFNRAKQYLNLESLGEPHLERVQALAILGGLYLHYIQQPHLANAIMGATLRMATTLGLHRESPDSISTSTPSNCAFSVELRRRIWWCVFNLDAWAGSTLGRPSMGRMGYAITAKVPQESIVSLLPRTTMKPDQ
jgi:Fungal specific transcription factor domain